MVDEYFDLCIPLTMQGINGAKDFVGVHEHRGARESSGETGVKLGASGKEGRQETTSSCGRRVSRDDTSGVGTAEDSCRDKEIKSEDAGGEDEQIGAHGNFEKSQNWWMVSLRRGGTGSSQKKWWMVQQGAQGQKGVQGDREKPRNRRAQWVLGVQGTAQGSTVWGKGWVEAQAGDWGTG